MVSAKETLPAAAEVPSLSDSQLLSPTTPPEATPEEPPPLGALRLADFSLFRHRAGGQRDWVSKCSASNSTKYCYSLSSFFLIKFKQTW